MKYSYCMRDIYRLLKLPSSRSVDSFAARSIWRHFLASLQASEPRAIKALSVGFDEEEEKHEYAKESITLFSTKLYGAHLLKNILMMPKSRSLEKMLDNTEVQNLVSNGNADPLPGLLYPNMLYHML